MCGQGEGEGPCLCFTGMARGISPAFGIHVFDCETQTKPSVSVKITGDKSFDKNK